MPESIQNIVRSIQDIMRRDAGVDGDAQRIGQVAWLLFLKIIDDKEQERELFDPDFISVIPQKLQWRAWAADETGITGAALLRFVNEQLFPALQTLAPGDERTTVVRRAFADTHNYMKNGTLLRQVVNKINLIDFNSTQDRHIFGDVYEQLLRDLQSAGNSGEFYTPRPVTSLIIELLQPQLGNSILDPACGTGGFLTCAIEYLRKAYVEDTRDEEALQASIRGVEKKSLPHLLCTTNLLLHGIDNPSQIQHGNALSRPLRDYGRRDLVDIIVTNPPFGGMEAAGIEAGFPAAVRTRETADLFLTLIVHRLKAKGRAAVVLPDGTLFGEGVKTRIKERLMDACNLHTIVRLPNGIFSPYTGIRTNILFFDKGKKTNSIWFYEHQQPEGLSYNKTRPVNAQEFDALRAWWPARTENENAWQVSANEIANQNFNLDQRNPNRPPRIVPRPELVAVQLTANEAMLTDLEAQLKSALLNAVGPE